MAYKNFLLIRTDRIGDVILTTPAIDILKKKFPDAKLYFLTRPYTAPLLKHYKGLDQIIEYRPDAEHQGITGHLKLAKFLRSLSIDTAFLLYPKPLLAFTLFKAKIPVRIGSGYRWYSFFLNRPVFEHRKYGKRHELEYNLSLIEPVVNKIPEPDQINFSFMKDSFLKKLREKTLLQNRINNNYIIIHPGSGGSAPNLPAEKYAEIVRYLADNQDNEVVVVGDHSEKELVNKIVTLSGKRVISILGEWDLERYMSVISGAASFISNSTGPLHIARAFNIPLLAFYCPAIPCSPGRWGPYNQSDAVITPDLVPCKSCNINKCPHGNCLDQIEWEEIRKKLDRLISIHKTV
jgi:heptosyltransferase-2